MSMMSTHRILAASLVACAALTFSGCGDRDLNYKKVEVDELKQQVRDLESELAACEARSVHTAIGMAGPASDTTKGQETIIDRDGVMIGKRPMETWISVPGSILFKPGSARLTTPAKSTLARIIALIKEKYPDSNVRVDGFTDNEPISRSKDKWDDNWDLSGGRALSVLHFLQAHGIEAKELGFAGFGEQRTKAPNTTESNRAKNRRVEIVVSPKHASGSGSSSDE